MAGRAWPAVVDVSWQPRFVRDALTRLAATTGHWVYVSSCSVYADDRTPGEAEHAPLREPYSGDEPVGTESYGPAKVACEQACVAAMGVERTLVARAGFVTGRNDVARAAGLVLRPLQATVSATLRWEQEQGLHRDRRAGLGAARESALLERLGATR